MSVVPLWYAVTWLLLMTAAFGILLFIQYDKYKVLLEREELCRLQERWLFCKERNELLEKLNIKEREILHLRTQVERTWS